MIDQLQDNLYQVLAETELPQQISAQDAIAFFCNYLEEVKPTQMPKGPEVVFLTLGREGMITVASSVKIPNLRFRLAELLREVLDRIIDLAGASGNPLVVVLASLLFLHKVGSLTKLEIGLQEAELLLGIYKLTCDREGPTVDQVVEVLGHKLSEAQIAKSLDTLEKLSCIALTTHGIVLNETIVFQRED